MGVSPEDGFARRFWDLVCDHETYLKLVSSVSVLMLVMLALAMPAISADSPSFIVLTIDLVFLIPLLSFSLFALLKCKRRNTGELF